MERARGAAVLAGALAGAVSVIALAGRVRAAAPEGYLFPVRAVLDGGETGKEEVLDFVGGPPHVPLVSLTLYNDGPDEVYPGVNCPQRISPMRKGENLNVDFQSPRIGRLYLVVGPGRSSTVRGFGLYLGGVPPEFTEEWRVVRDALGRVRSVRLVSVAGGAMEIRVKAFNLNQK
jgi:hypothetical protein